MSSSKKQAPLNERDGNLLVAASNQLPQDDEEQEEVVVVEKYYPASRARSPIEDCTVDQIVVTVGETNPIKKPKKNQPDSFEVCTRLKCIGSVSIQKLSLDHLRSFCSKIKMTRKNIRSLKKSELCQLLVERKCKYDQDIADGKPDRVLLPTVQVGSLCNKKELMHIHCSERECPGIKNETIGSLPTGERESHGGTIPFTTLEAINRGRRYKTPPDENTKERRVYNKRKLRNQIYLSSALGDIALQKHRKTMRALKKEHRSSVSIIRQRTKASNPNLDESSVKKMAAERIAMYEKMRTAAVDSGEEGIYDSDVEIPSSQESLFQLCYKQKAELENEQLEIEKAEANLKEMEDMSDILDQEQRSETPSPRYPKRGSGGKPVATKKY